MNEKKFYLRKEIREGLSEETLNTLFTSMRTTRFESGERLITRGAKGDKLFIVQEGSCSVIIEKDGEELPIVSLKPGDLAGEMALITGEPRTAHVDAETDVVVLEISKKDFDAVCENFPAMHEVLSKIIQENIYSSIFMEHRDVGKYTIQELVGKGASSSVYKGIYRHIEMPVAVKVLGHEVAMNPIFLDNYKEDAIKILQINHKNLVTVYDIVGLYRTIFIFMEYLAGNPLYSILDHTSRLGLPTLIDLVRQICSGLAAAHDHGLVHKQLNPTNIFVVNDNQLKIIDFGLTSPPGPKTPSSNSWRMYMPPEQISGESPDERTDIYSLGITAFEMISGQRPFPDNDGAASSGREIRNLSSLCPDIPDELCNIVTKACQANPANRYQTVADILIDLKPLIKQ